MSLKYQPILYKEFFRELHDLPPEVQPRALDAVLRLIEDPWARELHPEKVRQAENGVYSCRVDQKYRIIYKHIKPNHIVFCSVDNHDEAYRRAVRKTFTLDGDVVKVADILEVGAQPSTAFGPQSLFKAKPTPGKLFIAQRDADLLKLGVPEDYLPNIRALDDVNQLEAFEDALPEEVFNRLLEIALDLVDRPQVSDDKLSQSLNRHQGGEDLYQFVDSDEFKRALNGSMAEWMLFLAPFQRDLARCRIKGPARIRGVAGSGKTVVAIHRAYHLARQIVHNQPDSKVLFLTYGNRLPGIVNYLLEQLAGPQAPELNVIECVTIHQWCRSFLKDEERLLEIADNQKRLLSEAIDRVRPYYTDLALWQRPVDFFKDEIQYAIKGRAIRTLDAYLQLDRSGRGTALRQRERHAIFQVYQTYQQALADQGRCDFDDWILTALDMLEQGVRPKCHYVSAVVDEIQDLSEAVIRLIRQVVEPGPNDLFLVGDGLQRLYPGGYSLSKLGIDVVGRSALLKRNYRNTQEILRAAHAMVRNHNFNDLEDTISSAPEPVYSARSGPVPTLHRFDTPEAEIGWICAEIKRLKQTQNYANGDFVLLYRWRDPYQKLIVDLLSGVIELQELTRDASVYFGPAAKHTTFDSSKGLEFKVVFVVGVTDGSLVPKDDWTLNGAELEDYLTREKQRLYVAMTRARDLLYLTCSRGQPSRFLDDVPEMYLKR